MSRYAAKQQFNERPEFQDRLRAICDEMSVSGSAPETTGSDADVLVDFVYRDIRCVLFRVQQPTQNPLSPREQEIVRLVAAGHPNKVIAAVLDISYWTVGTHLRRIFGKLGVTSRAAMVAKVRNAAADAGLARSSSEVETASPDAQTRR